MNIRKRAISFILFIAVAAAPAAEVAQAQDKSDSAMNLNVSDLSEFGILNNSIANLHAESSKIWVGPFLNYSADGGATWYVPETDSLFGTSNRLFSIDVEGDVVVAGLGRSDQTGGDNVQTAAGFLISEDGGETFSYRFPQLDAPEDDTQVYGISILPALPVIVPQQSPPFDIDFDSATGDIFVAGWASGIRRSSDMGRTWTRVVLPPDVLSFITPGEPYSFSVEPQRGGSGSLNHMGFAVLAGSDGLIWAGTAGGLNRSDDGGYRWQRFNANGTASSLTGDWIISIEEQVLDSGPVVWTASWNTSDSGGGTGQFGVTFTRDAGQTFVQTLLGERVYDFAFDDEVVYAAAENGLFISSNFGRSWDSINQFRDQTISNRLVRPGSSVFSVEVENGVLWVGTSDGLLKSLDGGQTWSIFRVNVPLHASESGGSVPDVDAYAYPNPFSRGEDVFVRIKYELDSSGSVDINIYDFGMNLVRQISESSVSGIYESLWDGTDDRGVRVANGTYFYEIKSGGSRFRGKILVIE